MSITAAQVNELRQATGAGLMDCKKALTETNGNMEDAIDFLRKKGAKVSADRAERSATEGVVIAQTSDDHSNGVIINLSCETDFVAKNDDFVGFAQNISDTALSNSPSDLNSLLGLEIDGLSIGDRVTEQVGRIGEKIEVSNYETVNAECVIPYIHAGNKIGVLVALNQPYTDAIDAVGKDIAMQIAAMSPIALDKDDVDQATLDKEREIAIEQMKAEGKPEEMAIKIAEGKMNKFFKESTLLNQAFVKDGDKSVKQILQEVDSDLTVTAFKRVALGN